MASRMEWHLLVQEEADLLRLFLFENKVENIAKRAKKNAFNKPSSFLSHTNKTGTNKTSKPGSAHPILIV